MHLVRSKSRRARFSAASIACALTALALGIAVLAPAASAATETRSFINTEGFKPNLNAEDFGPANHYPGKVVVAGVPGTVTKVSLTTIDLDATLDLDMALVGPNGAKVLLMSDKCNFENGENETYTFEDTAPIFVPTGCKMGQSLHVKPTNDGVNEGDDDFPSPGPTEPFENNLAVFNGISPNGNWNLFLNDDAEGLGGFSMVGFTLSLEIEPPPAALPVAPTIVTVPVPTPVAAPAAPVQAKPAKTGKRSAALAKCAKKKTSKARKACRIKARKLPV